MKFHFHDAWNLARGKHRGLPLLIRYRPDQDVENGRIDLPHLLTLTWRFRHPPVKGLPTDEEMEEMNFFEMELFEPLEKELNTILTHSITTHGKRELYAYTRDVDTFSDWLHAMPQQEWKYPVTIKLTRNEGWEAYEEIVASCREDPLEKD